jgi:inner membrane protein
VSAGENEQMTEMTQSLGRIGKSPAFKFFLICLVILLLLIPLLIVSGLISERESRANSAQIEVARIWGKAQTLSGPFLIVPYAVRIETTEANKKVSRLENRRAVFLPDTITATGKTMSKVLHRSIFDVSVYTAGVSIEGRFSSPDMSEVDPNATSVRWHDATLALTLTDVSGLKEATSLEIEGAGTIPFAPSIGLPTSREKGIHVKLSAAPSLFSADGQPPAAFSFKMKLDFTGSQSLSFSPTARKTRVALTSDWPHPSFMGAFLPAERKIDAKGFSANWRVPHLARSVPNAWNLNTVGLSRFKPYHFGVTFYQPVEFYDLVTRAVKYGVLFLAVAFMGVFVIELTSRSHVHPVQYLFVGLAMVFFYVLLLSLAEHTGFTLAYLTASIATGGMLSTYVGMAFRSVSRGGAMAALFAVLYAFLYLILQLEDYALLAGAILGFVSLTTVMFVTLRIDWSAAGQAASESGKAEA